MAALQKIEAALQRIEAARQAEAEALQELDAALQIVRLYSSPGRGTSLDGADALNGLGLPSTLSSLGRDDGQGGDDVWAHLTEEEAPVPLAE